ncbi:MAG: hypothetical protein ACX932_05015 [Gammaproteobacteria bacterium]
MPNHSSANSIQINFSKKPWWTRFWPQSLQYRGIFLLLAIVMAALFILTLIAFLASGAAGPAAASFIVSVAAMVKMTAVLQGLIAILGGTIETLLIMAFAAIFTLMALNEVLWPGGFKQLYGNILSSFFDEGVLASPHLDSIPEGDEGYNLFFGLEERIKRNKLSYHSKTNNKFVKVSSVMLRFLGNGLIRLYFSLKMIVLLSPLVLPFYASFKEITGPRAVSKRNKSEKNVFADDILQQYLEFIPTQNIQDITLLRTLLNPFQMLQMTLTWLVVTYLLITNPIVQALIVVSDGIIASKKNLYGNRNKFHYLLSMVLNMVQKGYVFAYGIIFLALNVPKQCVAFFTHALDAPLSFSYWLADECEKPDNLVEAQLKESKDDGVAITIEEIELDEEGNEKKGSMTTAEANNQRNSPLDMHGSSVSKKEAFFQQWPHKL